MVRLSPALQASPSPVPAAADAAAAVEYGDSIVDWAVDALLPLLRHSDHEMNAEAVAAAVAAVLTAEVAEATATGLSQMQQVRQRF